jgi:hypothetical protein
MKTWIQDYMEKYKLTVCCFWGGDKVYDLSNFSDSQSELEAFAKYWGVEPVKPE